MFLILDFSFGNKAVDDPTEYDQVKEKKGDENFISGFLMMLFTFTGGFVVLPTYREIENPTPQRGIQVCLWLFILFGITSLITAVIGVLTMGSEIDADFLVNLQDRGTVLSILANLSYSTFMVFHLPFIFQYTKEYLLIIYDEFLNDTMQKRIEAQLKAEIV